MGRLKKYIFFLLLFNGVGLLAQFKDFVPAKLYLKNDSVLHGQAKLPLWGKIAGYKGKESIRFLRSGTKGMEKFDEETVDSIILKVSHAFKVINGGKKEKKSIKTSEKFVYRFLGSQRPQLVKEFRVGSRRVYEKIRLINQGGMVSGTATFPNAHMYSFKGMAKRGHYFFYEGSEKRLIPLPNADIESFIGWFDYCQELVKSYESFGRQLHPLEIVELLKKFPDLETCSLKD